MKQVIELLKQKNNYLTQFNHISAREYHRLQSGNYSNYSDMKKFYQDRKVILDAIDDIDLYLKHYQIQSSSPEDKELIIKLFKQNRELTMCILQKDLFIHYYLNDLQSDVVEDQIA